MLSEGAFFKLSIFKTLFGSFPLHKIIKKKKKNKTKFETLFLKNPYLNGFVLCFGYLFKEHGNFLLKNKVVLI